MRAPASLGKGESGSLHVGPCSGCAQVRARVQRSEQSVWRPYRFALKRGRSQNTVRPSSSYLCRLLSVIVDDQRADVVASLLVVLDVGGVTQWERS